MKVSLVPGTGAAAMVKISSSASWLYLQLLIFPNPYPMLRWEIWHPAPGMALDKKLGVRYSEVKHLFPASLNSTLIANYLNPHFIFFTHEEIRNICQELKLEFDDFP